VPIELLLKKIRTHGKDSGTTMKLNKYVEAYISKEQAQVIKLEQLRGEAEALHTGIDKDKAEQSLYLQNLEARKALIRGYNLSVDRLSQQLAICNKRLEQLKI